MSTTFSQLYAARYTTGRFICVGLDPDLAQVPSCVIGETDAERVYNFLADIVDTTHAYAAAYKPQISYYEALGPDGLDVLRRIISYIRSVDPTIPVILDAKRADIGRTNEAYVSMAFDLYGADAVTVHPYLGMEAMSPFLVREDKTIIVLCRTSNPGAGEFQDVECTVYRHRTTGVHYSTLDEYRRECKIDEADPGNFDKVVMPLYQFVAHRVAEAWNTRGNCALVVGATYADKELKEVRDIAKDVMILIPGIGAQGGDLAASIQHGVGDDGWGVILNNSSALTFAYAKIKDPETGQPKYQPEQYVLATAEAIKEMHDAICNVLILQQLESKGAIIQDQHLVYSSFKHGPAYVNVDPAFPDTEFMWRVGNLLVAPFLGQFDVIVAPATGGVALSTVCAIAAMQRGFPVQAVWADKQEGKVFVFERDGFAAAVRGKRVLVVDDVMTNANEAGSVFRLCRLVEETGGLLVGVNVICNRCEGTAEQLEVPYLEQLSSVHFSAVSHEECQANGLCSQHVPIVEDIGHGAEFKEANPNYPGGYTKLLG